MTLTERMLEHVVALIAVERTYYPQSAEERWRLARIEGYLMARILREGNRGVQSRGPRRQEGGRAPDG
jgi:hypothetical protein